MTYYRVPGRAVVHRQISCPRLQRGTILSYVQTLRKKPSHTTICDLCQARDARDKRVAKKQRPMARGK